MKYIIEKDKDIIVNLGSSEGNTVLEIIKAVEKICGKRIDYDIADRRPGDPPGIGGQLGKSSAVIEMKG